MFTVELYVRIRRAVMVEGLSRREAATRSAVHRNTITKMLQYSVPPGYRRRERPARRIRSRKSSGSTPSLKRIAVCTRTSGRRCNGLSNDFGMNGDFPAANRLLKNLMTPSDSL
jgi:transposase